MPFEVLLNDFQVLILIAIRVLVMLSFTPIISNMNVPFIVRIVLAVVFAYIVKYIMRLEIFEAPQTLGVFIVLLFGEALIGMILGFYLKMVYQFLSGISEFFSTLMGLRVVQVIDPFSGSSSAVITQFMSITVIMVFLTSHGLQRFFYYGVTQSFVAINAYSLFLVPHESLLGFVFFGFAKLFERAFIISFPIFIALLLVSIGLGLWGKVAPQINLLVLGMPLQLGLGLLFLFLFFPPLVRAFEINFDNAFSMITSFIKRVRVQ